MTGLHQRGATLRHASIRSGSLLRRGEALGAGSTAPVYYTAGMVRALGDESRHWPRYETVHGELLVTPAPRLRHQEFVARLLLALRLYLEREPVGIALPAPSEIPSGADTLVQPDVFVLPTEEARTLDWSRATSLMLVAEVLSPGAARADRFARRLRYQEAVVPLYPMVDAEAPEVEVWTPSALFPLVERETLVWHPTGAREPFTLSLEDLYRPL